MASNYEKYKDMIRVTNAARRAALKRLADMQPDVYKQFYIEEAKARGLNPTKIERMTKRASAEAEDLILDSSLPSDEL